MSAAGAVRVHQPPAAEAGAVVAPEAGQRVVELRTIRTSSREDRRRKVRIFRCCRRPNSCNLGSIDRKSTRLNSSHLGISYAVFCLKKKNKTKIHVSYKYKY